MLLSVGGVLVLVVILVALDPQVRESASRMAISGQTPPEVSSVYHRGRELVWFLGGVVREQTSEHWTLMVFLVAGGGLTMFMLRT